MTWDKASLIASACNLPALAPMALPATRQPSTSLCGSCRMISLSLHVPGSPSSALTTRYLGLERTSERIAFLHSSRLIQCRIRNQLVYKYYPSYSFCEPHLWLFLTDRMGVQLILLINIKLWWWIAGHGDATCKQTLTIETTDISETKVTEITEATLKRHGHMNIYEICQNSNNYAKMGTHHYFENTSEVTNWVQTFHKNFLVLFKNFLMFFKT